MFVVAIAAILVAIAMPLFFNWKGRAYRSEAKMQLGALFKVEKAHFVEHHTFSDDLTRVGYRPEGKPRYLVGFTSDGTPSPSGRNDTAELCAGGCPYSVALMVDPFGGPLTEADLALAPLSANGFTASAAGNIDNDSDLDVWTVDDANVLTRVASDL
jgi:type II secretory pathway pseudopilin PulG